MKINKIILKLNEEQLRLLNQLEESKCPLLMEVIIYGINRIKAISHITSLLQKGQTNFTTERESLITSIKEFSPQSIPVDLIQVVHKLQVLNYVKVLLEMGEEE